MAESQLTFFVQAPLELLTALYTAGKDTEESMPYGICIMLNYGRAHVTPCSCAHAFFVACFSNLKLTKTQTNKAHRICAAIALLK